MSESAATGDLFVVMSAATDVGEVREHNEDTVLCGSLDLRMPLDFSSMDPPTWENLGQRGPVMIVCDGMGGTEGGEVASELASRSTWREMSASAATKDPEVFARLLRRAVRVANHDVHAMAKKEAGLRGMGTTLSAAGIVGDRLVVATVGDSRVYILRSGVLVQVSHDQSLASALVDAGHADEAASAGGAILQALGVAPDVDPSLSIIQLRKGDRVLLCSDGLHGLVGDPALALLMGPPHTIEHAVRLLVTAARAAGGLDNITAVVCEVGGDRLQPPRDDDDLPTFREFDPQKEGDPALTDESFVARRLAARVGIPTSALPSMLPVTGQHAVMHSSIGIRLPATSLPIEVEGPAGALVKRPSAPWWVYLSVAALACALAWWLGGL
ncbi:MAG TPA: protein phosphatase 2C domain-containing protein [Kofleriaceae bacterium]|jgi:protein phosphatase